jgi:hypothetical protein
MHDDSPHDNYSKVKRALFIFYESLFLPMAISVRPILCPMLGTFAKWNNAFPNFSQLLMAPALLS